MTQHNKDIMTLIKDIRKKLAEYGPKSRQGRELYNSLITIYSLLDVTNEPALEDEHNERV